MSRRRGLSFAAVAVVAAGLLALSHHLSRRSGDEGGGLRPAEAAGRSVPATEEAPESGSAEPAGGSAEEVAALLVGDWRPVVADDVDGVARALAEKTVFRFERAEPGALRQLILTGERSGQPELLRLGEATGAGSLVVTNARGRETIVRALDGETIRLERDGESGPLILKRVAL